MKLAVFRGDQGQGHERIFVDVGGDDPPPAPVDVERLRAALGFPDPNTEPLRPLDRRESARGPNVSANGQPKVDTSEVATIIEVASASCERVAPGERKKETQRMLDPPADGVEDAASRLPSTDAVSGYSVRLQLDDMDRKLDALIDGALLVGVSDDLRSEIAEMHNEIGDMRTQVEQLRATLDRFVLELIG